jgi:hypothetical protein
LDIAEYKIDIDAIETYIKLLRAGEGIERKEGEKR